jgi:hypothetical protein
MSLNWCIYCRNLDRGGITCSATVLLPLPLLLLLLLSFSGNFHSNLDTYKLNVVLKNDYILPYCDQAVTCSVRTMQHSTACT